MRVAPGHRCRLVASEAVVQESWLREGRPDGVVPVVLLLREGPGCLPTPVLSFVFLKPVHANLIFRGVNHAVVCRGLAIAIFLGTLTSNPKP
jgi:hypothetical protein